MGGYIPTPIVVSSYCRIPERRLVSGLLTVNVVSSYDNDAKDDFYDYFWSSYSSQDSDKTDAQPWGGVADSGSNPSNHTDPNRTGYKYSFGDYDCFLFWVAGGMTQQDLHWSSTTPYTTSQINSAGGYSDNTNNVWYPVTASDRCQSFVKYHLISRINNGYGHIAASASSVFQATCSQEKHSFRSDNATVDAGDSTTSLTGNVTHAQLGHHKDFIVSEGMYSDKNDGGEALNNPDQNTYFSPVDHIEIYGKHRLNIASQSGNDLGGGVTTVYSVAADGGYHTYTHWDLVVNVKMRGYDDGWSTGSPSQADKEWFKSRINIFFQPFGETGNLSWDDELHTT